MATRTYRDTYGMNWFDRLAVLLVVIGGLNWLAVGLFNINFVALIAANNETIQRVLYIVIGIAAIYGLYMMVSERFVEHTMTHRARARATR